MYSKQYLSRQDLKVGTPISELLSEKWPSILCFLENFHPTPEQCAKATLIVTDSGNTQLEKISQLKEIAKHIPILILGSGDDLPLTEPFFSKERLIDYLKVPVSYEILLQRVAFLRKVASISYEYKAHSAAYTEQLDFLHSRDSLTGLYNRRQLTQHLIKELPKAYKEKREVSLLIFNIDYFNDVNKTYGLHFGDFILNSMGARVTEKIEKPETCYRFSSEDFAILLPDQNADKALLKAETIREACSGAPFFNGEHKLSITVSIGIASLQQHRPDDFEKFIFMAESALFTAKAEGRDRIQFYVSNKSNGRQQPQNPLKFLKQKLNRILDKTRTSAIASLQLLAKSIAGPEHKGHAEKVSQYVTLVGEKMGLDHKTMQTFQNSITLYTSFRFLLHSDLYSKPSKLTKDEWKTVEDLPVKIEELIDMFDYFKDERKLLLSQNENYDGSGYPNGTQGGEIPLGARIMKIADSLAAMSGDRAYRKKLTPREIIEELRQGAGKQFDPALVLMTLQIIKEHKIFAIDPAFLDQVQQDLAQNIGNLQI